MRTKGILFKATLLGCFTVVHISAVRGQQPTATPAPVTPTVIQPRVIEDPSVRAGWRRYQFGDEPAFSVVLPSPPKATLEQASATSIAYLYISSTDTAVYAAVRVPGLGRDMEHAPETERQVFFRNYVEGVAKGFQESINKNNNNYELKLLDMKKVHAAAREAFQQDFTVGPFQGSAQLVFIGAQAFGVMSVGNPQSPVADREAFLNSFKLTVTPIKL